MAGVVVCIISWNSEKLNCSTDKAKTIVTFRGLSLYKGKKWLNVRAKWGVYATWRMYNLNVECRKKKQSLIYGKFAYIQSSFVAKRCIQKLPVFFSSVFVFFFVLLNSDGPLKVAKAKLLRKSLSISHRRMRVGAEPQVTTETPLTWMLPFTFISIRDKKKKT